MSLPPLSCGFALSIINFSVCVITLFHNKSFVATIFTRDLNIILIVNMAKGRQLMAISATKNIVVISYREFTTWKRCIGFTLPISFLASVYPWRRTLVARRIIDLIHSLRPLTDNILRLNLFKVPLIIALEIKQICIFPVPCLTPVFKHSAARHFRNN